MCSEAVWWRCHRALVADYLKSVGVTVYHIMGATVNKLAAAALYVAPGAAFTPRSRQGVLSPVLDASAPAPPLRVRR